MNVYLKFWVKTALYRYVPGGYRYVRRLRKFCDPAYVYSRDKHSVRDKHHLQSGWKEQNQGDFHYRDYKDYQEYVDHQGQKFEEILKIRGGFTNRTVAAYRYKFYRRFRHLSGLLPKSANILCAGARQGTEVEVLRDIGFKGAYGIDLNPGPDNKFVCAGDFMHLENPNSSLDMIYSNALDHAFNLESFFREHARVIKPGGYVLYDIAVQDKEHGAFEAAGWKSQEALFLLILKYFKKVIRVETEPGWMWALLQGKTGAELLCRNNSMGIDSVAENLLPSIENGRRGKAFSLALHRIDHYINIRVLKKREVIRKVNNYPMILNFDEEGLSEHLMIYREREIGETETVKRIVKPGMCILEIGANVGYYTILMGKLVGKTGKICSYEPYPNSVDILTRNVKLNNLADIVEVHNLAVSSANTVTKLYLGSASNVHSLINYKTGDSNPDYIEVEAKDIREILVSAGRKFDLLRMDIEGHERELFNRLSSDIEAFLPSQIFFEIHPLGDIDPDPTFTKSLTNMLDLGYYPELVISSFHSDAKKRFGELNYQPFRAVGFSTSIHYLYDNIKASDLLKVAARRPKIVRAILLKRQPPNV